MRRRGESFPACVAIAPTGLNVLLSQKRTCSMDLHLDPKAILNQAPSRLETKQGKSTDPEALRKVCQQFESILTQALFKGMRQTVPKGGVLEMGRGEQIFQEMMDMEMAQQASQGQGLGIGEALYRQLQKGVVDK